MRMNRRAAVFSQLQRAIIYDSFDRADASTLGDADSGQTWIDGNGKIVSNQAMLRSTQKYERIRPGSIYDVSVEADIIYNGVDCGLIARCLNFTDYAVYFYASSGANVIINQVYGGSTHCVGIASFTWASGDTHHMRLSCYGNSVAGYVDGTLLCSGAINASLASKPHVGLYAVEASSSTVTKYDNFMVKQIFGI